MNRSTFCVVFVFVLLISFGTNAQDLPKTVRFGVCADVHKDIMHDADERLQIFVDRMNEEKVDFIIHLGDFCRPYDYNNSFMKVWRSFDGPGYHVLGNHDMDGGFTREQTMTYWSMPARFYSFDKDGYHFIVLDGNDPSDPPLSGYARFIGEEQQKWLRADLAATDLSVIVFSHQSIEDKVDGVVNKEDIRKILESTKHENGEQKVIACFSGHHHTNYYRRINGIYYIQINSMSDWWMGSNYANLRYSEEIDKKYPYIRYTAPYKEPLYALVSLDPAGVIKINGVESEWVGPSPWELNYPYLHKYDEIVPRITDRMLYYSKEKMELTPAEQPKSDFRYVNINPHGALFENQQTVTLTANENDVIIRYTLDGSDPVSSSALYLSNLLLSNSNTLKATAFRNGKSAGIIRTAEFHHVKKAKNISLNNPFSPKYKGGGKTALIDLVRGTGSYDDGKWQGYEGKDLDVVLDIGELFSIKGISVGFLKSEDVWIFLPEYVEFAVSLDGRNFRTVAHIDELTGQRNIIDAKQNFTDLSARFIRIRAKNVGVCPPDHPDAGGKAWLFADEIIIE